MATIIFPYYLKFNMKAFITLLFISLFSLTASAADELPHETIVEASLHIPVENGIQIMREKRGAVMMGLTGISLAVLVFLVIRYKIDHTEKQSAVVISLVWVDTKCPDYYNSEYFINDQIPPVEYMGSRIWSVSGSVSWYLLEQDSNFYAFDIREVAAKAEIKISKNYLNPRAWLCEFIYKLNAKGLYIDIPLSVSIVGK